MLLSTTLFVTATATPVLNSKIYRVDRISPFSNELSMESFPVLEMRPSSFLQSKATLAPNEAFIVNITCDPAVSASNCALAKKALENCGARIAAVLTISHPIIVNALFKPFCGKTEPTCSLGSRLGSAISASAFAVDDGTQLLMYPQALIKQLQTDKQLEYSSGDIIAEFNSDQPFFFRENGADRPTSAQYDFEFVASHEMTHGLGFKTGFLDYSKVFNRPVKYLAPLIAGLLDESSTLSTKFSTLQPIDIFDSFVVGSAGEKMKDLGKTIESFPKQSKNLNDMIVGYEASESPFTASKKAYQVAIKPTTFKANDVDVKLFSPSSYAQGSSGSHVIESSISTDDFLMVPSLSNGVYLDDVMKNLNTSVIYGRGIKAVMEKIGWPTATRPDVASVKVAMDYNPSAGSDFRSVLSPSILLLGIFGIILL
jgi:hypothetical protein